MRVEIAGVKFASNSAANGGALWVNGINSSISITGTLLVQNSAIREAGGLGLQDPSSLQLNRVVIDKNRAGELGGGLSIKVIPKIISPHGISNGNIF